MESFVGPLHLSTHGDCERGFTTLSNAGDAPAAAKPTGNVEDTPHQRRGLAAACQRRSATAITAAKIRLVIRRLSCAVTAWIDNCCFLPSAVTKQEITASFKCFLAEQASVRPQVDASDYATMPPSALQFMGLPITRAATRLFRGQVTAPSNR